MSFDHAAVPQYLRSQGRLDLSFKRRDGATAIGRAYQAGCIRMRLPRREHADEAPCAVLINTAGGVAEGDRIEQSIQWDAGTCATVTTQAAEKVYRALAHGSEIETRIEVGRGAEAEWLPQETILFDGARLRREARIILDEDVSFLGVEAIVLGRAAMGETMRSGCLRDRLRIWRAGELVYADTLALDADVEALMARAALGGGAGAMAVLVHASARAASLIDPVREALGSAHGRAAASAWNGLLAVRLLAPDGETLRRDVATALAVLRGQRSLPRVWRC
ncbi:MAG: urease accessory protein UreD [Sphingobium sp.]